MIRFAWLLLRASLRRRQELPDGPLGGPLPRGRGGL